MPYEKIFIVTDNPKDREIFRNLLQENLLNIKIDLFQTGKTLLEHFSANSADLIISDSKMPSLNGIQLVLEIRKIDPVIPIILLYNGIDEDSDFSESDVLSCGATLIIAKEQFLKSVGQFF